MKQNTWELKDVVMMAVLGVVFAAVYMAVFEGRSEERRVGKEC